MTLLLSPLEDTTLEHLNRDRVTPVLAGFPAVWLWLRSWFLLRLILVYHAINKACGETGSPSILATCRRVTFAPPSEVDYLLSLAVKVIILGRFLGSVKLTN